MARKLKDPKRAAQRKRERESQERRGLHEARLVVPKEHDHILRECARRLRLDADFAVQLEELFRLSTEGATKGCVEHVPADQPTKRPSSGRKGKVAEPGAAMRDLFDGERERH